MLPTHVVITEQEEKGFFLVCPVWAGVDRPNTGGIVVRGMRNAKRLERAYLAGAAFSTPEIRRDVNGKTYVNAPALVMGKYLNANLKRLGY